MAQRAYSCTLKKGYARNVCAFTNYDTLTCLTLVLTFSYLKINLPVKTPLLEFMAVARSQTSANPSSVVQTNYIFCTSRLFFWTPGENVSQKHQSAKMQKLLLKVKVFAVSKFLKNPQIRHLVAMVCLAFPVFLRERIWYAQLLFSSVKQGRKRLGDETSASEQKVWCSGLGSN